MAVTLTLEFPLTQQRIKEETTKIREQIEARKGEIEMLRGALKTIYAQCKHEHPGSGYNERDGNWASPCIHCGYSY
jgi:hypothetical protein